jgi:FtsH-binding integral membrane protein
MNSDRPLAIATAIMFCVSTVFPVVAAIFPDVAALSSTVGVLDGILAFALVILAMVLHVRTQGKVAKEDHEAAYRAYRMLLHAILVLLVVFFLLGDRIAWHIGLVGLAWRTWLLLYTLPAWYTALRTTS